MGGGDVAVGGFVVAGLTEGIFADTDCDNGFFALHRSFGSVDDLGDIASGGLFGFVQVVVCAIRTG